MRVLIWLLMAMCAGERLLADGREAAGARGQQHARAVQDDADVEALANQAGRREQVHQGDRSLVGDGVDEDEGLLAGVGLDVLEDLLVGVEQDLAVGGPLLVDGLGHLLSSLLGNGLGRHRCPPVVRPPKTGPPTTGPTAGLPRTAGVCHVWRWLPGIIWIVSRRSFHGSTR